MWRCTGLILLATLACPVAVSAQVNTEKLRSWETAGPKAAVDFSLTNRTGNVDLLLAGSSLRLQWATLKPKTSSTAPDQVLDLVYLIGDITLGLKKKSIDDTERQRFKNAGFAHLRWTHMWRPWLGSEIFAQAQYNEFIRLSKRLLGGVGARFEVFDSKYAEVVFGTGYMLEYEDNDVEPRTTVLAHRSTSYLSVKLYLADSNVTLVETVYAQPRLTDFGDYRIVNEGELIVKVTGHLEVVAGVYLRYDSEPVMVTPELAKLDMTIKNKLRVTF